MIVPFPLLAPSGLFAYIPIAILVWLIVLAIYRRYFHPLAAIPGPFFASITDLYVLKFNVFSKRSHLYLQIEKLHDKYGSFSLATVPVATLTSTYPNARHDHSYQTE